VELACKVQYSVELIVNPFVAYKEMRKKSSLLRMSLRDLRPAHVKIPPRTNIQNP